MHHFGFNILIFLSSRCNNQGSELLKLKIAKADSLLFCFAFVFCFLFFVLFFVFVFCFSGALTVTHVLFLLKLVSSTYIFITIQFYIDPVFFCRQSMFLLISILWLHSKHDSAHMTYELLLLV